MQSLTVILPRAILGAAALPIGLLCLKGAYENGCDFAGMVGGAAFASAVVACWFIPAVARSTTMLLAGVAWIAMVFGTAWVLVNAIGYAAKHRTANVGTLSSAIADHDRALEDRTRLEAEMVRMKQNPKKPGEDHPRWIATAGCANATVVESTSYCDEVRRVRAELAAAGEILLRGRPLSADPMADSLRKLIDLSAAEINDWWPIWAALISEILATVCVTLALAPIKVVEAPVEPVGAPQTAVIEPEPDVAPRWLSTRPAASLPFDKPVGGHIDGRKLRWMRKAKNDNEQAA